MSLVTTMYNVVGSGDMYQQYHITFHKYEDNSLILGMHIMQAISIVPMSQLLHVCT